MTNAIIRLAFKTAQWFADNPTLVLETGRVVFLSNTRKFKVGDGSTQLQNLVFYDATGSQNPTWGAIVGTLSDQSDLQAELDAKEDVITAGTTAQYWRGDKTFQTLDKTAVGLSNVDNTSDANKPISTATQTALNAKQDSITGAATTIASSNLTASRALVSDTNGKVAAATTTAAEIGFVNGVTSAIQAQLNAKAVVGDIYFTLGAECGSFAPVDATTYYFGAVGTAIAAGTVANTKQSVIPFNCTLIGFSICARNSAANATTESSTFSVRQNNTTDILLSNTVSFGGTVPINNTYSGFALNTDFSAGDTWEIKWASPPWSTNPTGAVAQVTLYFKRR